MTKVTRCFKSRAEAKAWIDACVAKYNGKVHPGTAFLKHSVRFLAYVYGDITPEMAEEMKPSGKTFYEYQP